MSVFDCTLNIYILILIYNKCISANQSVNRNVKRALIGNFKNNEKKLKQKVVEHAVGEELKTVQ